MWLKAPFEKPSHISDSEWIESKIGIARTQVAKQIQDLQLKKYGCKAPLTEELRERIDKKYNERMPQKPPEAFRLNFPFDDYTLPQWVAYATRIHLQKVRGRISELKKTKNAVLILDTTSPSREKMSESNFLYELLRIYNADAPVKPNRIPIKSKNDFINIIRASREYYIHISAHGRARDENNKPTRTKIKAGIFGELDKEDVFDGKTKWWPDYDRRPSLIVATACEAGRNDLATAFWETGCDNYIAPFRKVSWINAAVFSTLFYFYLFVEDLTPFEAFEKTMEKLPDSDGEWKFFEKGKEKPVTSSFNSNKLKPENKN